jgi:hypothetical protein
LLTYSKLSLTILLLDFTFRLIWPKMPKEEKVNQFVAIRSMFVTGSVKKMRDIEKLYPTMVAKSLRINHSRYIQKLYKPEEFTIKQIAALSDLLEIDVQVILDVIIKQLNLSSKSGRRKG